MWYAARVSPPRSSLRRWRAVVAVALTTLAVSGLLAWNAEREGRLAVERLARAQATLARALANSMAAAWRGDGDLERSLDVLRADWAALGPDTEDVVVLVDRGGGFRDLAGRAPVAPGLAALVGAGQHGVVLPREDAAALGLPPRRAALGVARLEAPPVTVAVVASARHERDRVSREEWLPLVASLFVGLVIIAFGVWTFREERQQLALQHQLEREHLERERDLQLARAERIAVASALSLGIGHELATPLSVIAARVEQARHPTDPERSERALLAISQQVEKMRLVIHGFLALARGEAPGLRPSAPPQLAADAAREVQHRFDHAGVTLAQEAGPVPEVALDPTLMRQALGNLLTNALEASQRGQRVVLRLFADERGVAFAVDDEGRGIAPEAIDRAAQPFFTTRAAEGGTGLGLAITQEIVRHHGGTLSLRAHAQGPGTRAMIHLPFAPERHGPA